jgi:hypothetical protein
MRQVSGTEIVDESLVDGVPKRRVCTSYLSRARTAGGGDLLAGYLSNCVLYTYVCTKILM